jgi:hypothetical protein
LKLGNGKVGLWRVWARLIVGLMVGLGAAYRGAYGGRLFGTLMAHI